MLTTTLPHPFSLFPRDLDSNETFGTSVALPVSRPDKKLRKRREVKNMKRIQLSLSLVVFLGVLGYRPIATLAQMQQVKGVKPGVIAAMPLNKEGTYCHLRFPAIQGRTFATPNPQLKPATTRDIIDYYGPCDHDPLGKEEIESQTRVWEERRLQD
jgi:hypothetical protein